MVIINTINKEAFHEFLSPEATAELDVGEEVDWYEDLDETILGVVGMGENNAGWSCAVLQRDENDHFQVRARQHHFPTRHTADLELLRQLVGVEAATGPLAA